MVSESCGDTDDGGAFHGNFGTEQVVGGGNVLGRLTGRREVRAIVCFLS